MTSRIGSIALAGIIAFSSASAFAQGRGKPAPEGRTGLKVGLEAPKFSLKDQEGNERSLDDLLKKGPVALVFYRSADW